MAASLMKASQFAAMGDNSPIAQLKKNIPHDVSQADLDNGRLICLVGVAAIKPAEFVIFRIGQKTADGRN